MIYMNCIARQPIFDTELEVFGYEILYRQSAAQTSYQALDADASSSSTIVTSFNDIGVERLTGGRKAFINFTESLLLSEIATILPNDILIIEVLENIEPTPELVGACKRLKELGYTIALDDFEYTPEYEALLDFVDIIKIDFLLSTEAEIKLMLKKMSGRSLRFLAEKLEDEEMFRKAKIMGFSYFQGYFFSKPVNMESREISPMKVNHIQLMRYALQKEVDFIHLGKVIRRDVALTFRLLKMVNSVYYGLRYRVSNVQQALSVLGIKEIKKWISLLSMSNINSGKPNELIRISLIRGRFAETIAPLVNMRDAKDDLFMLGMFSLIDVISESPMSDILGQLNVSDEIADALLHGKGKIAEILRLIIHYERGEWDEAIAVCRKYNIREDDVLRIYIDTTEWVDKLI